MRRVHSMISKGQLSKLKEAGYSEILRELILRRLVKTHGSSCRLEDGNIENNININISVFTSSLTQFGLYLVDLSST